MGPGTPSFSSVTSPACVCTRISCIHVLYIATTAAPVCMRRVCYGLIWDSLSLLTPWKALQQVSYVRCPSV
jgi:hypothetical protein